MHRLSYFHPKIIKFYYGKCSAHNIFACILYKCKKHSIPRQRKDCAYDVQANINNRGGGGEGIYAATYRGMVEGQWMVGVSWRGAGSLDHGRLVSLLTKEEEHSQTLTA